MRYVKRNFFTLLFSAKRIGKHRTKIKEKWVNWKKVKKRTKMQKTRRAHQGRKNKIHTSWFGLKLKRKFGHHKPAYWWRKQ